MYTNSRWLALVAAVALVAPAAAHAGGAEDANTILIDGVGNEAAAYDQARAEALGFTTEVVTDAAVWNAKTTDDFKTYRALDLPDNYCNGPSATALASRAVWGPAVTGNVILVGGDPELHAGWGADGAAALVTNGIGFAADDTGKTGLWMALGCMVPEDAVLDQFGEFTIDYWGSDSIHIVAVHPALAGLTDELLSNWGSSTHLKFVSFPQNFVPLAIQLDGEDPGVLSFADGTSGTPFLLVRGSAVQAVGLNVSAKGPSSAERGTDITYTITYGNTGGDATGVVLSAPVPVGAAFVSATDGGTEAGGTVTWSLGALASKTTGLTVSYTVTASSGVSLTASGIAITDGTNSATADDVVTDLTGVALGVSASGPESVERGSDVIYTITYGNAGTDASGVMLTAAVPAGSTFVSATGGGVETGGTVTWTLGDLPGGSSDLSVTFTVTATTAGHLTASGIALTDGTHTATASSVVTSVTAVGLAVSASGPVSVERGAEVIYTITYGNDGTDATSVVLTAPVPPGATFVSATGGGVETSGIVTWTIGALAGGSSELSVTYTVTANTAGALTVSGVTLTDGTHSASAANMVTTVTAPPSAASTTTALTSSPNPSTVGHLVTLTAAVAAETGAPTGTVTFYDGATSLGTASISAGVATLTTANLAKGSHSLTAVYGGADGFEASTSAATTQVVNYGATGCGCGSSGAGAWPALLALLVLALLPRRRALRD